MDRHLFFVFPRLAPQRLTFALLTVKEINHCILRHPCSQSLRSFGQQLDPLGPGNSSYCMSWNSRHPVAHTQCDKLLLRLLSSRKPETQILFVEGLSTRRSEGRPSAFRRSFKILKQLSRCGYSRGCMFTPVSTLYWSPCSETYHLR